MKELWLKPKCRFCAQPYFFECGQFCGSCAAPPVGATTFAYNVIGDRTTKTVGGVATTYGCDQQTVYCEGGALSDFGGSRNGGNFVTTGNTINAPSGHAAITDAELEREYGHSQQWAVLGPSFVPLYFANYAISDEIAGNQCSNVFEWDAGFSGGNYGCKGFR